MFSTLQNYFPELSVFVFGLVVLFQLLYYWLLFAKFSFHKPKKNKDIQQKPVSIVVSAKNEAHNLIKSLPVLLTQQYNEFEVVVVNDNSNDETEQVIRDYMSQYPQLKLVNLTSSVTNIQGKKFPLSIGIKSASYDTILLTDADCVPSSPYWLQNMAKHFVGKTEIVLGYGTFENKPGFLNMLIHFDTFHSAIQYFSYALAKIPYMGVGRNLAYSKSLFYLQRGFASHNHIKYGDDDLFVNRAANDQNCDIEYFKGAFTVARPKSGLRSWLLQKKHHTSTRRCYKPKHKFLLNFYGLLMILFYLFFVLSLILSLHHYILLSFVIALFVLKIAMQYVVFGMAAAKLDEKRVVPYILFFDILFSLLNPFIYLTSNLFQKK